MSTTGEPTKRIALRLPEALLEHIDEAVQPGYGSRTEYIRQAIIDKLANAARPLEQDQINAMMSDRQLAKMQHWVMAERQRRIGVYHRGHGY